MATALCGALRGRASACPALRRARATTHAAPTNRAPPPALRKLGMRSLASSADLRAKAGKGMSLCAGRLCRAGLLAARAGLEQLPGACHRSEATCLARWCVAGRLFAGRGTGAGTNAGDRPHPLSTGFVIWLFFRGCSAECGGGKFVPTTGLGNATDPAFPRCGRLDLTEPGGATPINRPAHYALRRSSERSSLISPFRRRCATICTRLRVQVFWRTFST